MGGGGGTCVIMYVNANLHNDNLWQGSFEGLQHKTIQTLLECLELDPSSYVRVQVSFFVVRINMHKLHSHCSDSHCHC